ncbi:MAG: AtpZ/AtpI family protein [Anaerolineae bacterium]|nr:AtpZ/AtpI family protein [Anaerolineae bacterium]
MSEGEKQGKNNLQYAYNLTLASIAGQVGCLTLIIIFAALFAGLWLDGRMDSKPMFTIILLVGSVPVTLFLMFRVVKSATKRIKPIEKKETPEEEQNSGKYS